MTRPDGLPDQYWDEAKGVQFEPLIQQFNELTAVKAERDLAAAKRPAKPDDYKAELGADFKIPDELKTLKFEVEGADGKRQQVELGAMPLAQLVDQSDPRIAALRGLAHESGWDQDTYSKVLGLGILHELQEAQKLNAFTAEQIAKLGANGPARIDALQGWFKAMMPGKAGESIYQRAMMYASSDEIAALENFVKKYSSQGGAGFDQRHREQRPAKPETIEGRWYPEQQRKAS
jgi:hypothetical protein